MDWAELTKQDLFQISENIADDMKYVRMKFSPLTRVWSKALSRQFCKEDRKGIVRSFLNHVTFPVFMIACFSWDTSSMCDPRFPSSLLNKYQHFLTLWEVWNVFTRKFIILFSSLTTGMLKCMFLKKVYNVSKNPKMAWKPHKLIPIWEFVLYCRLERWPEVPQDHIPSQKGLIAWTLGVTGGWGWARLPGISGTSRTVIWTPLYSIF